MPPKGRPKKKVDVSEDKLSIKVTEDKLDNNVAGAVIKKKKIADLEKETKKDGSKNSKNDKILENGMNGSGETEEQKAEVIVESDVSANDKVVLKPRQKPAKTKGKDESVRKELSDLKEESSNMKEDEPKDLPPKRGRRAAKIANGNKDDETKTAVETEDLPRSRRNEKANVELSNAVKEENQPKPKETKAKANKKAKVQVEENSDEKEVPTKGAGRKRKNVAEKSELEKIAEETSPKLDENRQLRVALKRNQNLDEMAMQQRKKDDEDFEEPKVKNVKGPAKGKGKRAAKDTSEDSKPIKKAKEDSKSKGAAKKEKEKIPDVTALDFSNDSKTKEGKLWNFKIATWNVNGLRAWQEKNGMSYLDHEKPDIMCIQETKCSDDKLPPELANIDGYHCHWLAGDKEGYSGVGLLSKEKPISVQYGIDIEEHDNEGRVITAEYEEFYLVTSYIPNSGRGLIRLDYRQKWDEDFRAFIKKLDKKKPVVLCGDLNVAHEEIDLANPKNNKKTAGFTKEEREGFSTLLSEGFVDTFRHLYADEKGAYTFWTYMSNARAKNVGWRLDYFVISERFVGHLCDSVIRKDVYGSDHCPIVLLLHV